MTARVRCADEYGCRRYTDATGVACMKHKDVHVKGDFELVLGHRYRPCGWTGPLPSVAERFFRVTQHVEFLSGAHCPKCGGRVELVDQAATP